MDNKTQSNHSEGSLTNRWVQKIKIVRNIEPCQHEDECKFVEFQDQNKPTEAIKRKRREKFEPDGECQNKKMKQNHSSSSQSPSVAASTVHYNYNLNIHDSTVGTVGSDGQADVTNQSAN